MASLTFQNITPNEINLANSASQQLSQKGIIVSPQTILAHWVAEGDYYHLGGVMPVNTTITQQQGMQNYVRTIENMLSPGTYSTPQFVQAIQAKHYCTSGCGQFYTNTSFAQSMTNYADEAFKGFKNIVTGKTSPTTTSNIPPSKTAPGPTFFTWPSFVPGWILDGVLILLGTMMIVVGFTGLIFSPSEVAKVAVPEAAPILNITSGNTKQRSAAMGSVINSRRTN